MLTKEGIIVKTIKYQETSKIAFVLSNDGLFSYLIRNSNNYKSKNFSYSQELTKIAFDVSSNKTSKKTFDVITSGKVLDNYSNIKSNSKKLFNVIEILEIVYSLSSHVSDNNVFYDFLNEILDLINTSECDNIYTLIFKIKSLYLLGIAPNLSNCSKCGKKEVLFSLELATGTSKCRNCFTLNDETIYGDNYNLFRLLYVTKMVMFTKENIMNLSDKYSEAIDEVNKFLDNYYEHYLGYKSKTKKIINKINCEG